jgi:hypothetical protein
MDYALSCMATWRRSSGLATRGRRSAARAKRHAANPLEEAFQGVNCRWLRGHATTYVELGLVRSRSDGAVPNVLVATRRQLRVCAQPAQSGTRRLARCRPIS